MKKFSIIIPVYNEEEMIIKSLSAIKDQDYPPENYEVLIVNDGSKDKTKENVKKFIETNKLKNFFLLNQENQGRIKARLRGAQESKHNNLLFIDARVTIDKTALKVLSKREEETIMPRIKLKPFNSFFDRFLFLLRRKLYQDFPFPIGEKEQKITLENFNKIAKGTTAIMFNKDLFFYASKGLENSSRNANDDTKILYKCLDKVPFLYKLHNFTIRYHTRSTFLKSIKHIYERGPRFYDYYLSYKFNKKYAFIFLIVPSLFLILALSLIAYSPESFIHLIILLFSCIFLIAVWLSEKTSDIPISILLIIILGSSFQMGVFKGLFLRIIKKND